MQGGKELRDDRVDQAGRWGKECRSTMLKVAVIGVMGALLALLLKGEKAGTKSVGCFGSVPFDHGNFII